MNLGKATVIIPTLNEAEGIGATIEEAVRELGDPEIIVIDACSTDETQEVATRLGAKVLTQKGRGKGNAVAQVLPHVSEDTEWIVMTDGDFTYPFNHVPFMIKLLMKEPQAAMVTGNKSAKPRSFEAHIKKLLSNRFYLEDELFILMHRLLNGVRIQDPFTGLRVIRHESIKDYNPKAQRFDVEVELNHFIVKKKRMRIIEIPITLRKRLGGSKYGIYNAFDILSRMVIMAVEDLFK